MNWIKVNDKDESTLPPLNQVVWVVYLNDYDGGQVVHLGGRGDGGDGWLWGRCDTAYFARNWKPTTYTIECDDDYRVTHWAEIEWPEEGK